MRYFLSFSMISLGLDRSKRSVNIHLDKANPALTSQEEAPSASNTEGLGRSCPTNSRKKMNIG